MESLLPDLEEFSSLHGSGITIRMLMNHTSGLEDYVGVPYGDSYLFYIFIDEPLREWKPEELLKVSVDYGLQSVPGEEFRYSNTNYILLGLIIEKLSGKSYEAFVKERLIDPLSLEHTFVPESAELSGNYHTATLRKTRTENYMTILPRARHRSGRQETSSPPSPIC